MKRAVKPREKTVLFERALAALRNGAPALRRKAWHAESRLVRVGVDIFVMFPGSEGNLNHAPNPWKPYPEDILAKDWIVLS
jgi:hypothetical protein